jgi:SnoaL-like domain
MTDTTTGTTRYTAVAEAYVAAWNTTDAATRRAAVEGVFAAAARYTDPLADVTGHNGIAGLVAGVQQQFPGWTYRLSGPVDGHHDQVRFTWELGPEGADAPVAGFDVATLDADGRITGVLGFLDRVPAA